MGEGMQTDNSQVFEVSKYNSVIEDLDPIKFVGRVTRVTGLYVESRGPSTIIGEICKIMLNDGTQIMAEVVGIEEETIKLICYDEMVGIEIGNPVIGEGEQLSVFVGDHLLGRVLDGMGKDYDGHGGIGSSIKYPAFNLPSDAMKRRKITMPITTGIKAIDGMISVGRGQRIGIFAGSGVGKSTLLGMIARNTSSDVNVIALIGERGRELREFIDNDLGEEGMKKSVIVFASSNKPALYRVRGAYVATAIAEYFRDQGRDVNLMMDSLTRFAWAQREIGQSAGEPPATRGYPPSVFTMLSKLVERAGTSDVGSITGFYTVLVEGDDLDEPVSDTVRGLLDGHIVLSRDLAEHNHYPAIDVLGSISRLMIAVTDRDQQQKAGLVRELLAEYRNNQDLIAIGAYAQGANPKTDAAIAFKEAIDAYLKQHIDEGFTFDESVELLSGLTDMILGNTTQEVDQSDDLLFNM
jgi:flagellum-specific ATP synthase